MSKSIIVIGSGPGGYVAAIRASQLGFAVTVVEHDQLGGVCLNWGCIPTKSLLKSAEVFNTAKQPDAYGIIVEGSVKVDFPKVIERSRRIASQMSKGIEYLFKKNNVTVVRGWGTLSSKNTVDVTTADRNTTRLVADHIILATGAQARNLPGLPIDGTTIIGYREALTLTQLPRTMLVIGSGAIGVEMAYFYASMGTQVTLVETMPTIVPLVDADVSEPLERSLKKLKVKVYSATQVVDVVKNNPGCTVKLNSPKGEIVIDCDLILVAVGIEANIHHAGFQDIGIEIKQGRVVVNENYMTSVPTVYAIGDLIGTPSLAHVASAEAIACVEAIAGHDVKPINYRAIPSCIYTSPEIASVGYSEKQLVENHIAFNVATFPFSALGKATAAGAREGFVKLLSSPETGKILGAHLVGHSVTEMLSELVLTIHLDADIKTLLHTIHPHPTMSEAIMEAAAVACGEAIHV